MKRAYSYLLGLVALAGITTAIAADGRIYSDAYSSNSSSSFGKTTKACPVNGAQGDCCDDKVHQTGHHHHNPQNGPAIYQRPDSHSHASHHSDKQQLAYDHAHDSHHTYPPVSDQRPDSKSLVMAVESGNTKDVMTLLNSGASPNVMTSDGKRSLVHEAVVNNDVELVRLLLERGADPNALDDTGRSQLHDAVRRDRVATTQYLLNAGAKPNVMDRHDRTPLYYAKMHNQAETTRLLMERGAR